MGDNLILIDQREPREYREKLIEQATKKGIETILCPLVTGDYLWTRENGSRVVVERKTTSDLLNSIKDGRWAEQVARLVQYEVPILLIEGVFLPRSDGTVFANGEQLGAEWTFDRIDSTILAAQLRGLLLSYCPTGREATCRRLLGLWEGTRREGHSSFIPTRIPVLSFSPSEAAVLGMLTMLPGCGERGARTLLEGYGTLAEVVAAIMDGRAGTRMLPGITKRKVDEWRKVLGWMRQGEAADD